MRITLSLFILSFTAASLSALACTVGVDCPPPPDHPNITLFDEQALAHKQTDEKIDGDHTFISQADALKAQSDVLLGCTVTNVSGRTDTTCATTPNDPECAGMSNSLSNATSCNNPNPPGTQPACQSYGAYGYSLDEWLVFGQQFYNGMSGCFAPKTGVDKTDDRHARMQNLTDFASLPSVASGQSSTTGQSNITGNVQADTPFVVPLLDWQLVAAKVNDGATFLGLEQGELIHRASTGATFLSAITDSPFAEKLGQDTRQLVEAALADPSDTLKRLQEKKLALAQAQKEKDGEAAEAPIPPSETTADRTPASGSLPPTAASDSKAGASSGEQPVVQAGPQTPPDLAKAAQLDSSSIVPDSTGSEILTPPEPTIAAENKSGVEFGNNETSLFDRVSISYRHHAQELSTYGESKTAHDIRILEEPSFFKEL